ncbi:hypothetical protein [Mesorhizobium mediterraneum]|nr:hypothetical protein [Mesorhizobium mediterraneum]
MKSVLALAGYADGMIKGVGGQLSIFEIGFFQDPGKRCSGGTFRALT